MADSKRPKRLADIDSDQAKALLAEHATSEGHAPCGCDRCIVLRTMLRDRGAQWPSWTDTMRAR